MRFMWGLSIGILGLTLSGCEPKGEQIMIQNAQGAAYSQGYGDGCATARAELGVSEAVTRKGARMLLNNPKYKKGWKTGYKECKFREEKVAKLSMRN